MADYRVQLDSFSGPMDLLLYLVRRNEVDIVRLPIAKITSQFLEFLEVLQFLDLDLIGDFVVLASSLIEIKSRQVLPRAEEETTEVPLADDPCNELIEQLLEYKRYKDASVALEEQAAEWQERYPRLSDERPTVGKDPSEDSIKEVELWDLVSALSRVIQKKVVESTSSIRYDDTPISVYIDRIGAKVRENGRMAFSDFFEGSNLRSKIVGIFLAILELLRHHGFRAEQPNERGEIYVLPPLESPAGESAPASPTAEEAVPVKSEVASRDETD
ncbi:ScpA family protein [Schlesneria sp. DSM 10557]|uniref:segregation and condensation protein A n=1 Tax=Schlesneria sp. DSM 10557 TaxID=3044399 RepID=UPI0035A126F3